MSNNKHKSIPHEYKYIYNILIIGKHYNISYDFFNEKIMLWFINIILAI